MNLSPAAILLLLGINLPGYLLAQSPPISLSDSTLKFGDTAVGSIDQEILAVSNTSSSSIVIRVALIGRDPTQFGVSPVSAIVAANNSETVTLMFAPSEEGPKRASASISYTGSDKPLVVALRGTATKAPVIYTIAGKGSALTGRGFFSGDGGPPTQAELSSPSAVAVDNAGNVFIADTDNDRIRMITRVGNDRIILTIVGGGFGARLNRPAAVAVDTSNGTLYIADTDNNRILKMTTDGTLTLFAGTGNSGFSGDGEPAVEANLHRPSGLAVDVGGTVWIADTYNGRIRTVGPSGVITTIYRGLRRPTGLAIDTKRSHVYFADTETGGGR